MTDAATTEPSQPTSRRRLLIILAAVVVVVIALVVGSFLYAASAANGKVSDYDDAYATWKAKDKPVLLAATAKVPSGTFLTKDMATTKGLAKQQAGCNQVAASSKKIRAAADRLPTIGSGGLYGKVSSDYSDAGDKAARRARSVAAYVDAATKALAQIERDCRWNIAYNTSTIKPAKPYEKSGDYLVQPGGREPGGITCPGPRTCISSIAKKKATYSRLRLQYVALTRSGSLPLFGKKCEATSYGKACKLIAKSFDHYLTVARRTYVYVRDHRSTDNPRVGKEFDKMQAAGERYEPQERKAVLAIDPALKADKRIRKSPTWTDPFFARMATVHLADLKDERAAIGRL